MLRAFGAIAILVVLISVADARQLRKTYVADPGCNVVFPCEGVAPSARGEAVVRAMRGFGSAQKVYTPRSEHAGKVEQRASEVIGRRPAGCPHAYCGCGASLYLFGKIVPALNLAANWLKFPRTAPAPKMAAARPGHVMVLEQQISGDIWLVHDSNSGGGLTRLHARSIAHYTIVNPHG